MCEKLTARKVCPLGAGKCHACRGVDIEIPEEWRDAAPLIIEPSEYNSQGFDSQAGGSAAYALEVRLIARRSITVLNCRIAKLLGTTTSSGQSATEGRVIPLCRQGVSEAGGTEFTPGRNLLCYAPVRWWKVPSWPAACDGSPMTISKARDHLALLHSKTSTGAKSPRKFQY